MFFSSDFIPYIGADPTSHYQRKKTLQIFKDLEAFQIFKFQTLTLEDFDDFEFSSSVRIPYFKVKKKDRLWTGNLSIAKELYEYKYPFPLTEYFLTWKTIYHFQDNFVSENILGSKKWILKWSEK